MQKRPDPNEHYERYEYVVLERPPKHPEDGKVVNLPRAARVERFDVKFGLWVLAALAATVFLLRW